MPLRICFIASEVAPLAKTGGLADVAGALPRHLHAQGHDVRVVHAALFEHRRGRARRCSHGGGAERRPASGRASLSLLAARDDACRSQPRPLYLVHCPAAYDRQSIYTSASDEHLRFLILQRAALDGCQRLGFAPDVAHCNDWHTALTPLLLKSVYAWDRMFSATRSMLSIHNIGYQGVFGAGAINDVGGDVRALISPETRAGGAFNWLREGRAARRSRDDGQSDVRAGNIDAAGRPRPRRRTARPRRRRASEF